MTMRLEDRLFAVSEPAIAADRPTGFEPVLDIAAPSRSLRWSVVVPVKNEQENLPALIWRLAGQTAVDGSPLPPREYEVILLLNDCTDASARIAGDLRARFPRLALHVHESPPPDGNAHVGRVRSMLFDAAADRFRQLDRPAGLILSTDADTLPARDWIAQTDAEIARGVDGVGGRITLPRDAIERLPEGVRRSVLLDIGYRRALEEMRALYAPDAHDPYPRHHQHFGASLAVTAAAYEAAGGMPPLRSSEDVALYRAVLASGGKFRHSYRVKAVTSARFDGRAAGGLAEALNTWERDARSAAVALVESAEAAERRLSSLGLWRQRFPGAPAPWEFYVPPEPPSPGASEPIAGTLRRLRERNAVLRATAPPSRVRDAVERGEIVLPA